MEENFLKITNAVYKAIDFFPEGDPLRFKAKEKALEILENLTLISENRQDFKKKENLFSKIFSDIEILETYLKVATCQGWLENINFLIISKEYEKIKNKISAFKNEAEKSLIAGSEVLEADIKEKGGGQNNYTDRQKIILAILGKREKTQVSDIIKELPDVTKRTIRRDLDDLLRRGEIIRAGEWNRVFYRHK